MIVNIETRTTFGNGPQINHVNNIATGNSVVVNVSIVTELTFLAA